METLHASIVWDKNKIATRKSKKSADEKFANAIEIFEIEQREQIRNWEIIRVRRGLLGLGIWDLGVEIHLIKTIRRKKQNGIYKMPYPIGKNGKVKFNDPKPYCNKHLVITERTWFTSIPIDIYEKAVRRGLIPKTIDNIRYYLKFETIRLKTSEIVMLSKWRYFWQNLNLLLASKT